MGFLNGVKEVFSIGSTLDRMNQGIDGVVNYKSCSVENFFESQYGTINTIVSGGSDDIRFKVLRAHIAIAINDGFPVIVLHQGNPYIGSRLRNEFGGVVETNIVDIGNACYDPFYDLDGGAISELVMGAAPKSFDIKHNAKYYIEGVVELLKKSKKKPYFNLLATCPHTTLFDKIDDLVGKNQISDSDGQEIKSKLMIGQSESVKIESYFYTLQTQIQPFLYRTKSREKPVNVRKNISNKELLVINIGNIANELYVNVLIEELKRAIAYGSSAAVVLDSISIVGNDKLKELIMGLSGQVRFTVIGDDVVALSGSDEQLFTTLVGRAKKIVVLSHNAGTSAVKWSQVFGEHDKQEQSYSVSKGGSYNSPIPFMASPNYNKQVNYNWKREYIVKPEKIMNLGYGEAFVYSGDINELAHVTFR
ncbi:MAG: hypothetical protein ACLU7Q_00940 [Gallintestinimicrobium sp.]|uniref:hypothetical protein n=1 Tax=Gallintestinimicrobium sp. TaxID=2981655 RepID=UPI003999DF8C